MSSELDEFEALILGQNNLFKYGGPVLMSIGTVSCIFNLAVFTKKTLRKNPCSIYFIAYNVANFIQIYTSMLIVTLTYGYNNGLVLYNLPMCRLTYYLTYLFDTLSPSFLILASVDRVLLTSRNALTRQRSTIRLAYICITSATLFWLIVQSHFLVLVNIIEIAPGSYYCYYDPGIYTKFVAFYSLICNGTIPICMLVFGLWTIRNVRSLGRVVPTTTNAEAVVGGGLRANNSKDRQLIQMLIADISVYIIFNLMTIIGLLYLQISQHESQSLLQNEIQIFLLALGTFSTYIPFCVGCYTNLLVSKTFRHEVKQVLMCK